MILVVCRMVVEALRTIACRYFGVGFVRYAPYRLVLLIRASSPASRCRSTAQQSRLTAAVSPESRAHSAIFGGVSRVHVPSGGDARRLDIQGLRAVAVLAVVLYHAGLPVPGGFVGVDVFFVVSGFVITRMLTREWELTGSVSLGRFFLRRAQRLAPALAVTTTLTVLGAVVLFSPFEEQGNIAATAIGATFLSANIVIANLTGGYFDQPAETNPLLHTWSLSVEEQFYLIFPIALALFFLIGARSKAGRAATTAGIGVVTVLSLALTLAGSNTEEVPPLVGFYSPLARAWEFGLGALVAGVGGSKRWLANSRMADSLGALGMAGIVLSLLVIDETTRFPGFWTLLPTVSTAVIILAGSGDRTRGLKFLRSRPLVAIGDRSYSVYLWHWPLVVAVNKAVPGSILLPVVASILSLAPAYVSFRWIEEPFRRLDLDTPRRRGAFVGLVVVLPLIVSVALALGARQSWGMEWPRTAVTQTEREAYSQCTDTPFVPTSCTWYPELSKGSVLLVGDSQAYALAEGVIEAARTLNMRTVVSSRSGCPFSARGTTGSKPLDCSSWQRDLLEFALETQPDVVVIANRSAGYTTLGWRDMVPSETATNSAADERILVDAYRDGLVRHVEALVDSGIGVVVLQNIPEPGDTVIDLTILRRLFGRVATESFDASSFFASRSPVAEVELEIGRAFARVVVVDPAETLCVESRCSVVTELGPVYQDPAHLSREGSLALTGALLEPLRGLKR